MSFLTDALGVVGKIAGKAVPGLATALGAVRAAIIKDPEVEKALIDQEVTFRQLAIQEGDSIRKLYGMEVQSERGFVANARPGMLWLVFALIACNFVILPIVNTFIVAFSGINEVTGLPNIQQVVLEYPDLPEQVYWLIGSIFGLYTGARSWDKKTKASAK